MRRLFLFIVRDLSLIGARQGDGASDTILQSPGGNQAVGTGLGTDVTLRMTNSGFGVQSQSNLLTMRDCTIADNNDTGFVTSGTTVLTDCTIRQNLGSGIDNSGTMTVTGCLIELNSGGNGAGIVNIGPSLILDNTAVRDNTSLNSGGGIFNAQSGIVELRNGSTVSGNTANGSDRCATCGRGGGILNLGGGIVRINGSTVGPNNTAVNDGGGIFTNTGRQVELSNGSSVSGNTVNGSPNNCAGLGNYDLDLPNAFCASS